MKFPRLVYKSASVHKLVANVAEHTAALVDGWFDTVPEALGKVEVIAPVVSQKTEDLGTPEVEPVVVAPPPAPVAPVKAKKAKAAAPVVPAANKTPWD